MPNGEQTNLQNEHRQIEPRPVTSLLLDWRNPRLALDTDPGQDVVLKKMYQAEALDELAVSFVRNGYFWEEPLVVVPAEQHGKFVVVEGNRRLATLRLLLDPEARTLVSATGFPEVKAPEAEKLKVVPTVLYGSPEQVVPYLGFRHITGVKKWDPYSKARYVAQLIEAGRPISQIEDSIGDSERTVKKLYQAYVLLSQIKEELDIDDKEIRANFSLLEVALGQQPIKTFLGVSKPLPTGKIDRVVPENKLENLSDIISWVFGNRDRGEQANNLRLAANPQIPLTSGVRSSQPGASQAHP